MRTRWEAEGGWEYLLAEPGSGGAGCPLLLGLHGRGSSPERLLPFLQAMGGDFVHVLVRAPLPHQEGHGWYTPETREAELPALRRGVLGLLASLQARHGVAPRRSAVWGFSQGAVLALEVGLHAPAPLGATASVCGRLSPATLADGARLKSAAGRRVLLVHGVEDAVIAPERSREAHGALLAAGLEAQLTEIPGGHALGPLAAVALHGFLTATLGALRAPAQA
jgi:phospholipase/carboxylesterase